MLYYDLAESLSELDMLTYLIKELQVIRTPMAELIDDTRIKNEIWRIKTRASMDILIFGQYTEIYFFKNVNEINMMILTLLEMLSKLPELSYMNDRERYLHKYGTMLRAELADLSAFFYRLKDSI
ncbi:hypothetical protein SAMN06265348_112203 [Pedobacter westerhofensis]|uniref:Uncharacterized protein n=1 Tax=Pedobacter westerhofensis TaxID=425512 RepID=A0A521FHV5_9SPHI|nr:hypothetical protein [Pedobacter westerhofensis]SMO95787.1 hypothetical protein SAMN06265348_112203 [Pedobacter westerhofensis]